MSKKNKIRSHLLIPDIQWKSDLIDTSHLIAIGELAVERRPDVIICIGDFWDFPSLSSYAQRKELEGKRVLEDIKAGNHAMKTMLKPIRDELAKYKYNKWNPRLIFTIGNHDQRIIRFEKERPEFEGVLGYDDLDLSGWEVHDFLKIVEVDGVHYSHYFANPMSGRPLGGTAQARLKTLGYSFVMGHVQKLDYARIDQTNGKVIQGLIAGAFYSHDEDYKSYQGNPHWRGVCYLHDVRDGNYDLEVISIDRLLKLYPQNKENT